MGCLELCESQVTTTHRGQSCRDTSQIPAKVIAVIEAARAIFAKCDEMQASSTLRLQICMGIHAGPAVAAIVGIQRPKWVMFGAALDIARTLRRMAVPSSVLLSSEVENLLKVLLHARLPI